MKMRFGLCLYFVSQMIFAVSVMAQTFKMEIKKYDDIILHTDLRKLDVNNRICGVFEVVTRLPSLQFSGSAVSEQGRYNNKFYLFISPGSTYMEIYDGNRRETVEFGQNIESDMFYTVNISYYTDAERRSLTQTEPEIEKIIKPEPPKVTPVREPYIPPKLETASKEKSVDMILVSGGTFARGDSRYKDTSPINKVEISSFYMTRKEITQELWKKVMKDNPSIFKDDDKPAENITWNQAVEFCNKLSELDGLRKCYTIIGDFVECDWDANGYRLPTEAEWEYAAKGGNVPDSYDFGGSDRTDETAVYQNGKMTSTEKTGTKKRNELGFLDMVGNVYEWCWDRYDPYYYLRASILQDPKGYSDGYNRVIRGGSWSSSKEELCLSKRSFADPKQSGNHIGFRVVTKSVNY
ncbi:MAG: SUMF1/EgtB/PvdO family nonheme iron enzyme [Spirochaetes bacterium]|nr:SUMF1/EgtB/PvdO family nonheme iron enzyme [Spirochaetota bacterium]